VVSCYQNQPTTSMEFIIHGGVVLFVCDAKDGFDCGETQPLSCMQVGIFLHSVAE